MIKVGQICGDEVKIKIDSITDDKICATVVEVNEFWSSLGDRPAYCGDGTKITKITFKVGMELEISARIIKEPKWLPWFVLDSDTGRFEHYR